MVPGRQSAGPYAAAADREARRRAIAPNIERLGNRALLALARAGRLQRQMRLGTSATEGERRLQETPEAASSAARPLAVRAEPARNGAVAGEPDARDLLHRLDGGSRLDEDTRALMETRFGESFAEVRIHTGYHADRIARDLDARAFTFGQDIVFAEGEFAPGTGEGRRLLAHELTHVVQQRHATGPLADAPHTEREAQQAAHDIERGATATVRERAAPDSVQRALRELHAEQGIGRGGAPGEPNIAWDIDVEGYAVVRTFGVPPGESLAPRAWEDTDTNTLYVDPGGGTHSGKIGDGRWSDVRISSGRPFIPPKPSPAPKPAPKPKPAPVPPKRAPQQQAPPRPAPDIPVPEQEVPELVITAEEARAEPGGAVAAPVSLATLQEHLRSGADDLDQILPQLSDAELVGLPAQDRIDLLRWLTDSGERAKRSQDDMIRLLTTTPQGDAQTLVDALRGDDARLTRQLVETSDWIHQRALHQSFQLLYNTTLLPRLTAADLGQAPTFLLDRNGPPPRDQLDIQLELTPDGKLRLRSNPAQRQWQVPPMIDFNPWGPVRIMPIDPQGQTQGRFVVLPNINLFAGDNANLFDRLQWMQTPSSFAPLFPPSAPKIPIYGGEDFFTRFIQGPEPSRPIAPLSPAASNRLTTIRNELDAVFTDDRAIADAFRAATPQEFQQFQDRLGAEGMTKLFNTVDPFYATLIGSFGPVAQGQSVLNDKRAEFIVDIANRSSPGEKATYYLWMVQTMHTDDLRAVLRRLADDSHLHDTLADPALAGFLPGYLEKRGVKLDEFPETKLGIGTGIGRGLGHFWQGATTNRNLPQKGATWFTQLPEPYRKLYTEQVSAEFVAALGDPANLARAVGSEMTMGLSDIPIGLYHSGSAAVSAIGKGEPGQAAEAITPAAAMIAVILITHKAGKLGKATGAAAEAETGALLGPEGEGQFALPGYKGPVSPEAARVAALLRANPTLAAASAEVVDALGAENVAKAAGYVQANPGAARLVINNGAAGLQALLAAEGDVAAAAAILEGKAPQVPPALPPGPPQPKLLGPGPVNIGKAAEPAALRAVDPLATQLPENFKAYDGVAGGERSVALRFDRRSRKWVVNETIKGGNWISVKKVLDKATATATHIGKVVDGALSDIFDAENNIQRTPAHDPTPVDVNPTTYWRVLKDSPDRVTLVIQVSRELTPAEVAGLQKAAEDAVKAWPSLADLPPVRVTVQTAP
jgi:hypothetical protein